MLPFAEWLPDQPEYTNPGTNEVKNCLVKTAKSYGPLSSLAVTSDAMTAKPKGANSFRDTDGAAYTFAGDADNLYLLSGVTWNEISKTTDVYTVASDDYWRFIQYGERVIACNGLSDPIQSYVMGVSSAFADLAAAAPRARHAAVINNFVMVGNTYDGTDGNVANRVWWCAIDDPTDWPTIGSSDAAQKQSDRQDLPSGGWVQALIGAVGGADGAVFCENSIYRVTYEGAPLVFSFDEIERGRGTPAPRSVVNVGPFALYLGQEGFYSFNGASSTPIGNQKVDKFFYEDLDTAYIDQIHAVADPINKLVFWAYPSYSSMNGACDKMIIYNWEIGRWSYAEIDVDLIFRDYTAPYTLEQLDTFGTLETIEISFDSRAWVGGQIALSAFNTDHKLCRFTGAALEATLGTTEFSGAELFRNPNERMYIDGIRPYVDGGAPTVSLKYRDSTSASLTTVGPSTVDGHGVAGFTQSCRYARASVVVPAGSTWEHAQGIEVEATPDGAY